MSEFIDYGGFIEKLEKGLSEGFSIILCGGSGVGKTFLVYHYASVRGLKVVEVNASDSRLRDDLVLVLRQVRSTSEMFGKFILFLDECDGLTEWGVVRKIISLQRIPVILAVNELYRVPVEVQNICKIIKLSPPSPYLMVKRIQGLDFSKVEPDIRHTLILKEFGGERKSSSTMFGEVEDYFTQGKIPVNVRDVEPWLLDNAVNFYYGLKLYNFYRFLSMYDILDDKRKRDFLQYVLEPDVKGEVKFPYFFSRVKALKKSREVEGL